MIGRFELQWRYQAVNEREKVVLDNGIVRAVFDFTTADASETYSVLGDGGAGARCRPALLP